MAQHPAEDDNKLASSCFNAPPTKSMARSANSALLYLFLGFKVVDKLLAISS